MREEEIQFHPKIEFVQNILSKIVGVSFSQSEVSNFQNFPGELASSPGGHLNSR